MSISDEEPSDMGGSPQALPPQSTGELLRALADQFDLDSVEPALLDKVARLLSQEMGRPLLRRGPRSAEPEWMSAIISQMNRRQETLLRGKKGGIIAGEMLKGAIADKRWADDEHRPPGTALPEIKMGRIPAKGKARDAFETCFLYLVATEARLSTGWKLHAIAHRLGEFYGVTEKTVAARANLSKPGWPMKAAQDFRSRLLPSDLNRLKAMAAAGYLTLPDGFGRKR